MQSIVKEGSLGSILFKCQIISEDDIRRALDEQERTGGRFGEALVSLGIVAQEDIDWALSNQLNIPYVRLKPTMVDRDAVALVPAAMARQHNLIPLIRAGEELSIAIADPLNVAAVAAVEKETGCAVSVSVALIREIREMQERFYGPPDTEERLGFTSSAFPPQALAAMNHDLTGGKFLDYLLLFVAQQKLSSLSLHPLGDRVSVIARRGGTTREVGQLAPSRYPDVVMHVKKLAHIDGARFSARGGISFALKGRSIPFQVATLRGEGGDHLTFRMTVAALFPASIADLGLTDDQVRQFADLAAAGRGMVVTGARDREIRRRLTDLYLQEHEAEGKTVLVVGSDAGAGEQRFPRIPVPSEADLSAVVSACLEHDPDILVMEDVTDGQAFAAACRATLRGKLVVAGIGCGDAVGALDQLIAFRDMHVLVPAYLRGVVTCTPVRPLCPACRRSEPFPAAERAALGIGADVTSCWRSAGCESCDQTGHDGRRYLLDVLVLDHDLRERFEAARSGAEVIEHLRGQGWRGIADERQTLLAEGTISLEEYASSLHG